MSLALPESPFAWMRNYLALGAIEESAHVVKSELSAIRNTLDGWTNSLSGQKDHTEQWKKYRVLLRDLPEQKDSMYNEDFGVRKVFVMPQASYHRIGAGALDAPEIAPALDRLLGALVSNRPEGSDLVVLCGGPGSGKSTLCRMLASELAQDEKMHPVFLKLRRCKEGADLSSFLEDSLVKEGVISKLADLQSIPNVVLILDGFDELVLASRARLRHFFSVLLDDVRSGPLRHARVIVSGRDTLFPKGEGLPRGSHVLTVLPFDRERVALWGELWRGLHHKHKGPGSTFHPEALIGKETRPRKEKIGALQQLVSWPLTLHLLARVHTAGLFDISSGNHSRIEKAYLYRGILRETAHRQLLQTEGKGRLEPERMREFLRKIAWAMYSRSVDSMEVADVIPLCKHFFPNQDDVALAELAEVSIVSAPEIQKVQQDSVLRRSTRRQSGPIAAMGARP